MAGQVLTESRDGIAFITLSNPARHNAMTVEMWQELSGTLAQVAHDESAAVIIAGSGGSFSAGADITEFSDLRGAPDAVRRYNELVAAAEEAVVATPKPTIAVIRGACMGGGALIALACDLRFGSDDAKFCIPAAKLGTSYPVSTVTRLVRAVGPSNAFDMLASARIVSASEALRMGLVNRIASAPDLEHTVLSYLTQISSNAVLSIRAAKLAIRAATDTTDVALRIELARVEREAASSEDYREGIDAFLRKRPPRFKQVRTPPR